VAEVSEMVEDLAKVRAECACTSLDMDGQCLVRGFYAPNGMAVGTGVGKLTDPLWPVASSLKVTTPLLVAILGTTADFNTAATHSLALYISTELDKLRQISTRVSAICKDQRDTQEIANQAATRGGAEIEAIQEACEHPACLSNGCCVVCDYDTSEYPEG